MGQRSMRAPSWRLHAWVVAAYVAATIALSWPLPAHLGTHLTGTVGSDAGVYVWNQWVFQHELLEHGGHPFFTDAIFSTTGRPANLSLHNYTTFQNLLAMPLMRPLGVVTTFNVVYLLMIVLTAYATFLLARHVTGRAAEAWLAGLLFAWSPILVARGTGHYSLVAAAPLAIFLLVLMRADGHERTRDAVALGAAVWWAASTDVYYAVYCLLIGAVFLVARVVAIERSPLAGRGRATRWALDVMLVCTGALIAALLATGGWQFTVLGQQARVRSLYTPVLAFTVLAVVRGAWPYRASIVPGTRAAVLRYARLTSVAGIVAAALLSPVLYAVGLRLARGEFEAPRIFWRSSPPGVDVLALVLPNPAHPLVPADVAAWITSRPLGYAENVASIPWVAIAIVAAALVIGWRPSRWWTGIAALFGVLALGPFVHVAGVNTFIPGPWALLRYVPIAGLARTPARFSIVMMLALAVLVAAALAALGRRYPRHRGPLLIGAGLLLVAELLPVPLTLYPATVPTIYRHVKAAPDDTRLLELPFGVRDGTSSVGDFTARSQFYQTAHEKMLIGGYLSRVSSARVAAIRSDEVLDALALLSEGRTLPQERQERVIGRGPAFVQNARLNFVVIDSTRTPPPLRDLAMRAFHLKHVETDGALELYRPSVR